MWWKEEAEKGVCGKCSYETATQATEQRIIRGEKDRSQKWLLRNNNLGVLLNLVDSLETTSLFSWNRLSSQKASLIRDKRKHLGKKRNNSP